MAETEPERLSLLIHELMERQAKLRAVMQHALKQALTIEERQDIQAVLASLDKEIALLQQRLDALRKAASDGSR